MKLQEIATINVDTTNALYHLSKSNTIKQLTPQIPKKVSSRKNAFEDDKIARVSFAPSIKECILGLQLSSDEFTDGETVMYVYTPIDIDKTKLVSNDLIVNNKLVFDAKITKECWYLDDVKVKLVGSVTIYDEVEKTIEYTPIRVGDPKFLKPNGKLETYLLKFKTNQ